MANEEHVRILGEGVEAWNEWRKQRPRVTPDLSSINVIEILRTSELAESDLSNANLSGATLAGVNLSAAKLTNANLTQADLTWSGLTFADFTGAKLTRAILDAADFTWATLSRANLNAARLIATKFIMSSLQGMSMEGAIVGWTTFGDVNLGMVTGLTNIIHVAPSFIDYHTLIRSESRIPETFLKGCGLPGNAMSDALSAKKRRRSFYSCFISYSTKDQPLAERLHAALQQNDVQCWYAPEDMKIGDRIRPRIDESIRLHDKLLIVLSRQSLASAWVADEVEVAFEKERQQGKTVLFPITLDDAVWDSDQAWVAKVRRERHIGDFRHWKSHDAYQMAFERLLRDLKAEEK